MTTPDAFAAKIKSLTSQAGTNEITDEMRAALPAAIERAAPSPVFQRSWPPEIPSEQMDAMVLAAGMGESQPAGLSPEALALWPQLKAEIEEILLEMPEVTHLDYPPDVDVR